MQDTCFCFPTQVPGNPTPSTNSKPPTPPSPTSAFKSYISSLDIKIAKGLQTQNSQLTLRRKHLLQQLSQVRKEQTRILQDVRKRENYFEEHYYKYFKEDIGKYKKYNDFFKREFDEMDRKIAEGIEENRRRRVIVQALKAKLMGIMKENRETQRKQSLNISHSISKTTPTTIETTDISIRLNSQPDRPPNDRNDNRTHRLKNSMASCQELPKLSYRYMEPINQTSRKQAREEECKNLELLLEFLNFRREDRKNKEWNWLEELIFKQRNFEKIVGYLHGRMDFIRMGH